ncbi:hypothetical protein FHX69_1127 [Prauserella muralis]|nr:hypothetical protein FHX69_1127 [Prauserella muralis]
MLALAACGGGGAADAGAGHTPSPGQAPHGYVEGAEETAEPQPRLVVADGGTGQVRVLDLGTGETTDVGRVPGADRAVTDGRFAYLSAGRTVHVIDGGTWTVDHGDHQHYYRTGPAATGTAEAATVTGAHSDSTVTALTTADGNTVLLDRARLEDGSVARRVTLPGGTAVPLAERLVVSTEDGAVELRDRAGRRLSALAETCADAEGTAITRRGAVFGCADGALLVSEDDGRFTAEKIRYPRRSSADRARAFSHRPGSTTLAAPAGRGGVWALDVRAKTWRLFDTGPVAAVSAVGAGGPVLVLGRDGVLRALDSETGVETARTRVLSEPVPADGNPAPVIQADTSRAYVNDAAARTIREIDYADDLRVARTFRLDSAPTHLLETGR